MPAVPALKRGIRFRDLALFYVMSGLSIRWTAMAAAAGPSILVVWVAALLCFFVPLAASVMELSSRYPEEGGIYIWTRQAFGDWIGISRRVDVLDEQPAVLSGRALLRRRVDAFRLWSARTSPGGKPFLLCRVFGGVAGRDHAIEPARRKRGQVAE